MHCGETELKPPDRGDRSVRRLQLMETMPSSTRVHRAVCSSLEHVQTQPVQDEQQFIF